MTYRRRRTTSDTGVGRVRREAGQICEICQKDAGALKLRKIYRCIKCGRTFCEDCLKETGYLKKELLKTTAFCPKDGARMAEL